MFLAASILALKLIAFQGAYYAQVPVNGATLKLLIDSGSAVTMIKSIPKKGTADFCMGNGDFSVCTKAYSLKLVPKSKLFNGDINQIDGIIGSDMLSRFSWVAFDYQHMIVYCHEKTAPTSSDSQQEALSR